jgi:hypothetical protein
LAPSPIASVIDFVLVFTKSTICALFFGVARQQITVAHEVASFKKFSWQSSARA